MAKIIEIKNAPLIFFDLEMTGLSPLSHEIMEIGAVRAVREGTAWKISDQKNWLVAPTHIASANPDALKVFGYSESEWKDALPLETALREFIVFAEGGFLIGHDSAVDWSFLSPALDRFGIVNTADYHILDTASMAYTLLGGNSSISLGDLAERYGIKRERAHRASDDALTTFRVFSAMWNEFRIKSHSI